MRRHLAVLLVAGALLVPAAAQAHAALLKSVPGSRDTLARAPTAIVLRFNEPVEPRFSTVTLEDVEGKTLTLGPLHLAADDPAQVELAIPEPLPAGTYTVRYRVLSQDGHVVEYGYQFRVAPPAGDDH